MPTPQPGDTVRVHYTGTLADGTEFDSSAGREPLEFTVGSGEVIPGFDRAVTGLEVGATRRVEIPADEAYGERNPDMLLSVSRSQFPAEIEPEVGQSLQIGQDDGTVIPVQVAEVDGETVVLDANHPLAGEDLTFEIMLDSIG